MRIYLVRPDEVFPPVWYGVSRYTTCLVEAMHRLDPEVEFIAFHFSLRGNIPQERRATLARAGVELLPARVPDLSALEHYHAVLDRWVAPRWVDGAGCDLAWGTNCETLSKRRRRYRTAMTIHDLFLLTNPDLSETRFTHLVAPKLRRAVHETDVILTDSRFTASQIIELLEVPEEKITVTYAGYDLPEVETPEGEPAGILDELGIAEAPILSVGTVEPRKNYERGLEAYQALEKKLGAAPPWVIVGRDGWKFEGFYQTRAKLGLEDRVAVLEGVDDPQLARLYRTARCLFCPSLLEGFGLPLLEAMATGLPVVASTGGSLPEVGGEAAVYVDPFEPQAMADGLEQVLTDRDCASELIAKGKGQAAKFTWEQAAQTTLEAFRRVVG